MSKRTKECELLSFERLSDVNRRGLAEQLGRHEVNGTYAKVVDVEGNMLALAILDTGEVFSGLIGLNWNGLYGDAIAPRWCQYGYPLAEMYRRGLA
jgi:hypothetical protein